MTISVQYPTHDYQCAVSHSWLSVCSIPLMTISVVSNADVQTKDCFSAVRGHVWDPVPQGDGWLLPQRGIPTEGRLHLLGVHGEGQWKKLKHFNWRGSSQVMCIVRSTWKRSVKETETFQLAGKFSSHVHCSEYMEKVSERNWNISIGGEVLKSCALFWCCDRLVISGCWLVSWMIGLFFDSVFWKGTCPMVGVFFDPVLGKGT